MEQSEALREATNNQFQIDINNFVSTLNNYPRACLQKWQLVLPTQEDFNKFWDKLDEKQRTEIVNFTVKEKEIEQEREATGHSTNKAFERYIVGDPEDLRAVYARPGKKLAKVFIPLRWVNFLKLKRIYGGGGGS